MDYSSCTMMFTEGQKARMRAALENSVSGRNHLWINSNLIETGVIGGVACKPLPDFYTVNDKRTVCVGNSVTFVKNILNTTASITWLFPGGSPATSTAASPTITYNTVGTYDVMLIASNSAGTDTVIKQNYITVNNLWGDYIGNGYTENFEIAADFWYNWKINNLDNNYNTFTHVNYTGYNSSNSLLMNSFQNYKEDIDEIISPSLNLAYLTSATLSFKYAGASTGTSSSMVNDQLKVYYTSNCGNTWINIATISGSALANNGYAAGFFTPASNSQWILKTISLPTAASSQNVRFKFEYKSGGNSNNLYIDDININGIVGIAENANQFNLQLSPNPANNETTVSYHLTENATVELQVTDMLGKVIATPLKTEQSTGDYQQTISKESLNLPAGIYFIKLQVNNNSVVRKLIFTD